MDKFFRSLIILVALFLASASISMVSAQNFITENDTTINKEVSVKIIFSDLTVMSARMTAFTIPYGKIREVRIYSEDGGKYFQSISEPLSEYPYLAQNPTIAFSTEEHHGRRVVGTFTDRTSILTMIHEHLKRGDNIEVEFYLRKDQ